MGRGGNEVADIGGLFVLAFDDDRLVMGGVSGKQLDTDAGNDRRIAVEQSRPSAGDERIVVVSEIADAVAFVLQVGVGQFAALVVVAGARKGGDQGAIGAADGVPAAVVEVKMSVDDNVEIVGSKAGGGEIGEQALFVVEDVRASSPAVCCRLRCR